MLDFSAILNSHLTQGAISGALAAASVDINAFRQWKSFDDAAAYDWKKAAFRWMQGAIVGFLAAAGLGGITAVAT
jgi:hypothetical protein